MKQKGENTVPLFVVLLCLKHETDFLNCHLSTTASHLEQQKRYLVLFYWHQFQSPGIYLQRTEIIHIYLGGFWSKENKGVHYNLLVILVPFTL